MELFEFATEILLGIKFEPCFSYIDKFGEITQMLLKDNEKYSKIYKFVGRDHFICELFNDEIDRKRHNIKLTTQDIVIRDKIGSTENYFETLSELKEKTEFVKNKIFIPYKIRNIIRIGLLNEFSISKTKITNDIFQEILKINNIKNIRFTQISPTKDSGKKKIDDYYNVIFDIKEDEDNVKISIDFQHHLSPAYASIVDFNLEYFFRASQEYMEKTISTWINYDIEKE